MMASWGNSIVHQSELIQDYFCNFLKYEEKQFNSYKEVFYFLLILKLFWTRS